MKAFVNGCIQGFIKGTIWTFFGYSILLPITIVGLAWFDQKILGHEVEEED